MNQLRKKERVKRTNSKWGAKNYADFALNYHKMPKCLQILSIPANGLFDQQYKHNT